MMGHSPAPAIDAQTHWVEAADSYNLAVAIPQGHDRTLGWTDRVGELAYLEANIPTWINEVGADPSRVYLTGFSSGSNMVFYAASHASASQLPLAGIAPVSGWMNRGYTLPRTQALRLFYMLGSGDVLVRRATASSIPWTRSLGLFTGLMAAATRPRSNRRRVCSSGRAGRAESAQLRRRRRRPLLAGSLGERSRLPFPPAVLRDRHDREKNRVLQAPSRPTSSVRASLRLTPGATNPAVRQSSIRTTICLQGWASRVKPTTRYLDSLKLKQMCIR